MSFAMPLELRTDEGRRSFLISSSGLFEFLNFLIWVGWRLCFGVDVLSGRSSEYRQKQGADDGLRYPFPEIVSSGRLEVQTLNSPSIEELHKILDSSQPNFVYLQGEQLPNDEVGSLVWGGIDVSTAEAVAGLFCSTLPTTVYLEIPNGEKLAEALQSKGIPYVIYWKNAFFVTLLAIFACIIFSGTELAHASLRLYCVRNNLVLPGNSQRSNDKLVPYLLGDPPVINVTLPEIAPADDDESSLDGLPAIKIYDDDVNMKFLVCGVACTLDACLLGSLEDGLNALLSIEMRGSKLHNRVSALPPPLQAGTFSRGVVTMRCDLSTCSSAHISLLVSGSAQTCFDDLLLENHIKSEVIEKSQLVHALPNCEENKPPLSEPRRSASIACGQQQLAPDVSYRSLVALGIASIQGLAAASFEKDDEEFLKDVMQFLILRGHTRLIPQGGLSEFPDAILNAKRLDLFNLYREVVSRGGFHVGNGINWKGQVFSKMRNHTVTNRMTGVGNTLKRHYETYLLEYELAHDDVDGECCLLCHSSAAGDWVNCGICGEWAHFGCDRRQGLGAFKDYAKTDGLEYICPQCSISNFKKKLQKTTNGYS
ncbi:AT-rich interactive domain-containing protein 4 [Camellia lanceoleosa]|uniref:AT-rich interactive domain-containing protein 4 n=1 Tax=Camellia lanceoleosa TaxID=1840588 RepID=A0ACC0FCR0_9ERIC|nr:AT-rich interactive domain-containing protein 4 [Camellia lanceoleosa]